MHRKDKAKLEEIRRIGIAEEINRAKTNYFATLSHEIRTPLTVMSTYAQYAVEQIRESGVDEQTIADLATISEEAKRLAEMAGSTLKILMASAVPDVSKTDGGAQKYPAIDVGAVCSQLVKLWNPVTSQKGMKISVAIGDGIPEIPGDANALTQLMWNILQNAVTHSECKSIEIAVENCDGVQITINDDGVGIETKILPRIFEHGVSGKKGGSGIGLAICRDIAGRHGGDINIESVNGMGTKVTVKLRGIAENGGVNV